MFTFKTQKRSAGLAGIGEGTTIDIKLNKKYCGYISGHQWNSNYKGFKIRLMVKDTSTHGFRWMTPKFEGETTEDCKKFINHNFDRLMSKYEMHFTE